MRYLITLNNGRKGLSRYLLIYVQW